MLNTTRLGVCGTRKRMIVLANSHKHRPGRCIAGRLCRRRDDGKLEVGNWLRPVSEEGEGELYLKHRRLTNGREPHVLDIVDVPCQKSLPKLDQPENWLVSCGVRWEMVDTLGAGSIAHLLEHPPNLWLDSGCLSDRVTHTLLAQEPPTQSLFLVSVGHASAWEGENGYRVRFRYNGVDYTLGITDPDFEDRYGSYLYSHDYVHFGRLVVCVSLTPEFNGFHFKVVAALFNG